MTRKLGWAWIGMMALVLCYFSWTWGELPDRVATHFDAAGNPNGFQTKDYYLGFFLGFILGMNAIFGAVYFLTEKVPAQLVNIPWRNYWLANELRKSQLFERLRGITCLLGLFVNTVHLLTTHIIYQENTPQPYLKVPVNGLVALILIGIVFLGLFIFIILRPPADGTSSPMA